MTDRIPGTRVPDTPIHRASLWLERMKFADRVGGVVSPEPLGDTVELVAREIPAAGTPEQITEAAAFYGHNFHDMILGTRRVQVAVPSPTGEGFMTLRDVMVSLWLDAYLHGAATVAGKRSTSTTEGRRQ